MVFGKYKKNVRQIKLIRCWNGTKKKISKTYYKTFPTVCCLAITTTPRPRGNSFSNLRLLKQSYASTLLYVYFDLEFFMKTTENQLSKQRTFVENIMIFFDFTRFKRIPFLF